MSPYTAPGIESRLDVININKYVANEFGTTTTDMKSPSRKAIVRDARHVSSYLLYTCTDMTYEDIGDVLNRDYSTIIHSVKTAKRWAQVDDNIKLLIQDVVKELDLKFREAKVFSLAI